MSATFGKLEEFDTAIGEDWIQYIERMEYSRGPTLAEIVYEISKST